VPLAPLVVPAVLDVVVVEVVVEEEDEEEEVFVGSSNRPKVGSSESAEVTGDVGHDELPR